MAPWPVQRRRLARALIGLVIAASMPHGVAVVTARQVVFDSCSFEGDTFPVGSAPLCDPFTECSTDRYTCTIHPRLGLYRELWQGTCPGCRCPPPCLGLTDRGFAVAPPAAAGGPVGRLERVSIAPGGLSADAGSLSPALSDDGRFVVFDSAATNLIADDTNGRRDVFVFDRQLQQTERISVATGGTQANHDSIAGSISADGRFVAFLSRASNLVPSDTNNVGDVFVRDRQLQTTERVSVGPGGLQSAGNSYYYSALAAGSWPFARSDAFATSLYVDMVADNTETAISADGRFVAFISDADNLVPDDLNELPDVFVHDRVTATTERVSLTDADAELLPTASGPQQSMRPRVSISSTGQFVAFETGYAAVPEDTNGMSDVYVRDRVAGTTTRVSVSSAGAQGNGFSGWPAISGDGRYIAFASDATTFFAGDTNANRDIFRHDRQTGQTVRVSLNTASGARDRMLMPAISRDGRWVAYARPTNKQAYLFDAATGALQYISRASAATFADAVLLGPALNADGSVVAFASASTNLAPGDGNAADDVFVTSNNLIMNGAFATDAEYWQPFGLPAEAIVWEWSAGAVRFYRTGSQAVLIQPTFTTIPAGVPLEARFDVGNTSPSRRRFSVLIHDNDFSDLSVCTFWLAPNAPLATYRMRTHTTRAWTNTTLSIYAATLGSNGYYVVDNVSMATSPEFSDERTDCLDPAAPGATVNPDGANMLVNGDFAAGMPPWGVFGQITSQVQGGVFEFIRPPGALPAGVVLQPTSQALSAGDILRATFDLGNSSAVRKRVTVLLHDGDFSDLSACTFWIPPGQPLSPYEMRMYTTEAWTNATVSIYAATVGNEPWTRLDNVTFRRSPSTAIQGTDCIEPVTPVAPAAAPGAAFGPARPESVTRAVPLDTHVSASGSRYVTQPVVVSIPARLHLSFESALPDHAAPGQVQMSFDGLTWITIAEVSASRELVPVNISLDVPSMATVLFRFVAVGHSESTWKVAGMSVRIEKLPSRQ